MKKKQDNTQRSNATTELTPEEAKKKREQVLEKARKDAEDRGEKSDNDSSEDGSLATFILPGD